MGCFSQGDIDLFRSDVSTHSYAEHLRPSPAYYSYHNYKSRDDQLCNLALAR